MEKRALLAVTLSLVVLYIWSALFPPPRPKAASKAAPEASVLSVEKKAASSTVKAPSPPQGVQEDIATIETPELELTFSNVGGVLKQLKIKGHDERFPQVSLLGIEGYETAPFIQTDLSSSGIEYTFESPEIKIIKTFRLDSAYRIKAEVYVQSKMSNLDKLNILPLKVDTSVLPKALLDGNERSLLEYSLFANGTTIRKGDAHKFVSKEAKQGNQPVNMVAYRDRYYCVIVKPKFDSDEYSITFPSEHTVEFNLQESLEAAGSQKYEFLIYAGQQNLPLLKSYNEGLEEVVSFSNFGLFDGLAKFFYWIFTLLHKFIPNWGLCIILVGVLIYFAVYPLTMRGMESMRKMQLLQPEMAILREKYKNNPQKLNKEVMDLYKKYSINPFSGCFTFLLQMPVFIGIYQVLWRSPFFEGANFLWIEDLSRPDQFILLPQALPIIGNEINLLPIIMAVIMFFQQKISLKASVVVDQAQAAQQKIMLIFFPIFLGFIFYKFASGLVLYFTVFYALSAFTQFKMSKLKGVKANG